MLNDSFRSRYKNVPLAICESFGWGTEIHNHLEFELLYFEQGAFTVKVGDKTFSVSSGDIVLINPMEIHSITVGKGSKSSHKCICFDLSMLFNKNVATNLQAEISSVTRHIPSASPHNEKIRELFSKIYEISLEEQTSDEVEGEIYAMEMQAYLSLLFAYVFKNSLVDDKRVKPKSLDFYNAVISYVKNHYNEQITSKEIAKSLSFNQSYFCRNFKKNFGCNFTDYLNSYRLSLSRKMLEENKSITQVAYDLGFVSSSKFSKCFYKTFGVLPSKYKANSQ